MNAFNANLREIEPRELVNYLLRETGQFDRGSIDAASILNFLQLQHVVFDFDLELPDEARKTVGSAQPRALVSFADRIVASHSELAPKRTRFSILHEIGHFVLPDHEHALYVCDNRGISMFARLVMEKEASDFAADLLFLGDRFLLEANSRPTCAATVKELAAKYNASFEATARRMAKKSFKPCMLIAFKKEESESSELLDQSPIWSVRYCIASPNFKAEYFEGIEGRVPAHIATVITNPERNIADSETIEVSISSRGGDAPSQFTAEFFSNNYNIFCFLKPCHVGVSV